MMMVENLMINLYVPALGPAFSMAIFPVAEISKLSFKRGNNLANRQESQGPGAKDRQSGRFHSEIWIENPRGNKHACKFS